MNPSLHTHRAGRLWKRSISRKRRRLRAHFGHLHELFVYGKILLLLLDTLKVRSTWSEWVQTPHSHFCIANILCDVNLCARLSPRKCSAATNKNKAKMATGGGHVIVWTTCYPHCSGYRTGPSPYTACLLNNIFSILASSLPLLPSILRHRKIYQKLWCSAQSVCFIAAGTLSQK